MEINVGMSELESKALELIKSRLSQKEIEKRLKHKFIFYKDPETGEYKQATQWK